MLQLRLVDPREEPTVVGEIFASQSLAYSEFNAKHAVVPIAEDEVDQGCVYFATARDEYTGELAGSMRLYLRTPGTRLPVERLLFQFPEFVARIEALSQDGIAEIGSCWAQRRWRGAGLSAAMMRLGMAAMPLLGVTRGVAFSHHHVLPAWAPLGWMVDSQIARINYPDARYETSVIWLDPVTMWHAEPHQRIRILELRQSLRDNLPVSWSPHAEAHHVMHQAGASAT